MFFVNSIFIIYKLIIVLYIHKLLRIEIRYCDDGKADSDELKEAL